MSRVLGSARGSYIDNSMSPCDDGYLFVSRPYTYIRFIWKGATFRSLVTTLLRTKDADEWALSNIIAKYKALLFNRIQIVGAKDSLLSEHMRIHELHGTWRTLPTQDCTLTPIYHWHGLCGHT